MSATAGGMAQISREEFLARFGPGGLSRAEIAANKAQPGRQRVGQRRNDAFEPDPALYRGERRAISPEVSAQLAAEAAQEVADELETAASGELAARGQGGMRANSRFVDEWTDDPSASGSKRMFITPLTESESRRTGGSEFGRKVRAARGQQELLSALKTVDSSLPAADPATGQRYFQDGQSVLATALNVPLSQVSAPVAERTGQYMEILGLDAGRAFALARTELEQPAPVIKTNKPRSSVPVAESNLRLADLMREGDMFRIGEAATEIRPEVLGRAVADTGPNTSSVVGVITNDDPAAIAAHEGYHQLTAEETKRLAYESGNQRRIGSSRRRNPFLKEPFTPEQLAGGVPVMTGEATEQAMARDVDGEYKPAYRTVVDRKGSATAEPVMQVPQGWPVQLDANYQLQLRGALNQALYGNPSAPETQAAKALVRQLSANPAYAFKPDGRPQVGRSPDLAVSSLQVIEPTAIARSPGAVRNVLDTDSNSEVGAYGGIANTEIPDVGQGEHGFRDIDNPFTDKRFIEKPLTVGQYARALKQENLTPIRSYVLGDADTFTGLAEWPRGAESTIVGSKTAVPMVVQLGNQLWSVSQAPIGPALNGEMLYEHRLARPVYQMPNSTTVNSDGQLVGSFRVGAPGEGSPSMVSTEGFRQLGDFIAEEAALQGLTRPDGGRLELLSNQPRRSADVNALDYRLLVESGAINPAGNSFVAGEFPHARVTRDPGTQVSPLTNHLYQQLNALVDQASLPGDPRLTTFAPADSDEVRHYMAMLAPRVAEKIEGQAKARAAVGLYGPGTSDAAKRGAEGQPTSNAFALFDPSTPPALQQAASGQGRLLAPSSLPDGVRNRLMTDGAIDPVTGAFSPHGLNWLRTAGQAYLQDAIEQSKPRRPEPAASRGWMEGETYPRVPAAPMPRGDEPMRVSPEDFFSDNPAPAPAPAKPGGAMPAIDPDVIPEVSYVPTERGTYVITDQGTTRLAAPEGRAVVTGRERPSPTDYLVGEQLAGYVDEARARMARQGRRPSI